METRVKMRKFLITLVKRCYRSVCNHPFLVGMLCFLFLLYRSFPFLFSLLVSASPVLACTAVLLGTLLSLGQPNIPEIEKEEKVSREIASLKTSVMENATVVDQNVDCIAKSFLGKQREIEDGTIEEMGSADCKTSVTEEEDCLLESTRLIGETSREIHGEKQAVEEVTQGFRDVGHENNSSVQSEKSGFDSPEDGGNHYTLIQDQGYSNPEIENGEVGRDSVDNHLERRFGSKWKEIDDENGVMGGDSTDACLGSQIESKWIIVDADNGEVETGPTGAHSESLGSKWKETDEEDEEEDDDDDASVGSGSDHAESSSPDASMTDIMPMLDELHPLLEVEAPQPAHMSPDDSDVASQHSHMSKNGILESDEDNKSEDGDDDDVGEGEEEAQGSKEDESKSAITWTEDDQKNLMDLGTSELERNQRLENLIARRRARRMMTERNLIDFDADLPFNVPAIATSRRNPFDGPDDSHYDVGLPPIPGSAPSILSTRRNPFDLPYDPNEEKPDLKGDSFQQEFMTFHQKDAFFRRHESFSLGPSNLGFPKHEKQDVKWRPYFVPEQLVSEGSSFHSMQRQSSEVSDSKVSSIPDTESLSSNVDQDDKGLNEQDSSQETDAISNVDQASLLVERGSHTSEDVDSQDTEEHVEGSAVHREEIEITLGNADGQNELERTLSEGEPLGNVEGHNELEPSLCEGEPLGNMEGQNELEPSLSEGEQTARLDMDVDEFQQKVKAVEEQSSGRSSSSFYSEVSEMFAEAKKEQEFVTSRDDPSQEPCFVLQHQVEDVDFSFATSSMDDNQHKEPVYDSSPPAVEKFLSFKSISSDTLDVSEISSTPESIRSPGVYKESEEPGQMQKEDANYEEMFAASAQLPAENENDLCHRRVAENTEENDFQGKPSVSDEFGDHGGSLLPQTLVEHVSTSLTLPPSWDAFTVEGRVHGQGSQDEYNHTIPSNSDAESPEWIQPNVEKIQNFEREEIPLSHFNGSTDVIASQDDPMHREQVQVHSSADTEVSDSCPQHLIEQINEGTSTFQEVTSSDLVSSAADEQPSSFAPLTVSDIHTDSSFIENGISKGPSFDEEEVIQHVDDHSPSSSSDAAKHTDFTQNLDVRVASSGTRDKFMFSENELSGLGKGESFSDRSTDQRPFNADQQSFSSLNQEREALATVADTIVQAISNNNTDNDIFGGDEDALKDASNLAPDSTAFSPDTLEYASPSGVADLQDDTVSHAEIGSQIQASQFSEYLESIEYGAADPNIKEDDDIKEIDEEFLAELDNVGDFRVKQADDASLCSELLPAQDRIETPGTGSLPRESEQGQSSLGLPVIESKSVEDVTMALKQLNGGNVDKVVLPEPARDNPSFDDLEVEVVGGLSLQVDEGSPHGKNHINSEQISEGNQEEVIATDHKSADANEVSFPKEVESDCAESGISETIPVPFGLSGSDSNLSLPVLEARSVEDITMAFMELDEGANVEEVILPSSISDQKGVGESENSAGGTNSGLEVVEARSLDDILVSMKKVSESSQGTIPKDLHKDNFPEINEESSTKANESGTAESSVPEARSLHSSDVTVKHILEDEPGVPPKHLQSHDKSSVSEAVEVASKVLRTEETEVSHTDYGVQQSPVVSHDKSSDGIDGTSDISNST